MGEPASRSGRRRSGVAPARTTAAQQAGPGATQTYSDTRLRYSPGLGQYEAVSKNPRMSASTIQFTPFRSIPTLNASNAPRNQPGPLGAPPGPKSVAVTPEILLVYRIEDRHHRLLYDFVFQRRDADRPLPTVRFLQINPP